MEIIADDSIPPGYVFRMWKCEFCGHLNLPIPKCAMCRFREGPDNVWRIIGVLGGRADGQKYYIWGNFAENKVHYTGDKWFWGKQPRFDYLLAEFRPGTLQVNTSDIQYIFSALI